MRDTKLRHDYANKTYSNRLNNFNLLTVKYRQVRGEMIELFKFVTGIFTKLNVHYILNIITKQ